MSESFKPSVAIIDYGLGNLFSVRNACDQVGMEPKITSDRKDIISADAVILPGVGAFGDAMESLDRLNLVEPLREVALSDKPFLAICLGMQLLMSQSNEFGVHKGLDIIDGSVCSLSELKTLDSFNSVRLKVPHIGWAQIYRQSNSDCGVGVDSIDDTWSSELFNGLSDATYMYFVHSFYTVPVDSSVVSSISYFGGVPFCSSLEYQNIYACQFHPERSGPSGLKVYRNLVLLTTKSNDK